MQMKITNYYLYFILFALLFSCGNDTSSEASDEAAVEIGEAGKAEQKQEVVNYPAFAWDSLKGLYSGIFAGSEIRIKINYISDKNVVGYNVHKGLVRNLHGKVDQTMESVILHMEEPGDHEFDGKFVLTVDRKTLAIHAIWTPNDTIKLKSKKMTLEKVVYNEDYSYEDGVTESNFFKIFSYVYDELGEMYFHEDGLVIYRYYPNRDSEEYNDQYEEIKGSWMWQKNGVVINWEKNTQFSAPSHLRVINEDEYYYYLQMGDRMLHPSFI